MQGLFIDKDEEILVKFTVAKDKDNNIYCDSNEDLILKTILALGKKREDFEINNYRATFRRPSFGDSIKLYDSLFTVKDGVGNVNFNPVMAMYRKISSLIKQWDLKGVEETPSKEDILQLHPVVGACIGNQLDAMVGGMLG